MSKNHQKALRALDALLADDEEMSVDELRAELSAQGVNVSEFSARFSKVVRQGYQRRVRLEAEASVAKAQAGKTTLFGDLTRKSKAELLAIREQVINGIFGPVLQRTANARCRNHKGEEVSEAELRSWLEDLSASASDK